MPVLVFCIIVSFMLYLFTKQNTFVQTAQWRKVGSQENPQWHSVHSFYFSG